MGHHLKSRVNSRVKSRARADVKSDVKNSPPLKGGFSRRVHSPDFQTTSTQDAAA